MSRVLLINGSPNENGYTGTALYEIIGVLEKNGIQSEKLWLGKKTVADCMACMKC